MPATPEGWGGGSLARGRGRMPPPPSGERGSSVQGRDAANRLALGYPVELLSVELLSFKGSLTFSGAGPLSCYLSGDFSRAAKACSSNSPNTQPCLSASAVKRSITSDVALIL